MQLFEATVKRGQDTWIATIAALPEGQKAVALGRTWKQVRELIRETVALILHVPIESIHVDLMPEDPSLAKALTRVRETRAKAKQAQAEAEQELTAAARLLTQMTTVRDAATILDCSHQYVAKLAPKKGGQVIG